MESGGFLVNDRKTCFRRFLERHAHGRKAFFFLGGGRRTICNGAQSYVEIIVENITLFGNEENNH